MTPLRGDWGYFHDDQTVVLADSLSKRDACVGRDSKSLFWVWDVLIKSSLGRSLGVKYYKRVKRLKSSLWYGLIISARTIGIT